MFPFGATRLRLEQQVEGQILGSFSLWAPFLDEVAALVEGAQELVWLEGWQQALQHHKLLSWEVPHLPFPNYSSS